MLLTADGFEFDAICFGGGSLQTVAYLAELEALELAVGDAPVSTAIRHFAGSSAGALYAIACACGMRSRDLRDGIAELCTIFSPSITCLWRTYGLDDCTQMDRVLMALLKRHGVDINTSIGAIEATYDVSLSIFAIDSETKRGVFMPPACTLKQAFKCSAAIPIVFSPQYYANRMYLDGSFGNCWIPQTLPASHRWLWLRVQQHSPPPPPTQPAPPPPPRLSIEYYAMLVLDVARAPADIALEVDHVRQCKIAVDPRVPYIIPRMDPATMRRICDALPPARIAFARRHAPPAAPSACASTAPHA
jgi:hypothetical protein